VTPRGDAGGTTTGDPPAVPDYIGDGRRSGVQRFFELRRAPCLATLDRFGAPPRDFDVPLLAFVLRFLAEFFRPVLSGLEAASRPVATSSCRCSDPIMRPSDSAERSSSDSSSRDRSRDGCAGIDFLAIQSPFSRARCPSSRRFSKVRASVLRRWIARTRDGRNCLKQLKKNATVRNVPPPW
jgi:hypothetical protein